MHNFTIKNISLRYLCKRYKSHYIILYYIAVFPKNKFVKNYSALRYLNKFLKTLLISLNTNQYLVYL